MKKDKRRKREAQGWKVGSTGEFIGLSNEESEFIRMKLALARFLKSKRLNGNYSQIELAKLVQSSQSRVAKMEQGGPSVSLDLIIRSLLTLGATRKELAKAISVR